MQGQQLSLVGKDILGRQPVEPSAFRGSHQVGTVAPPLGLVAGQTHALDVVQQQRLSLQLFPDGLATLGGKDTRILGQMLQNLRFGGEPITVWGGREKNTLSLSLGSSGDSSVYRCEYCRGEESADGDGAEGGGGATAGHKQI